MPSNTVFTGVITAFYALLRYIQMFLAILRRGRGDIESGLSRNGTVAVSNSQDTESSSFYCRGVDDSIVWTGPYVPYQPQLTSTPKRICRGSSGTSGRESPEDVSLDIGCLSLPSIEPQTCRSIVSDKLIEADAIFAPSIRAKTSLRVANPDDDDYVFVNSPSAKMKASSRGLGSSRPPPFPSLVQSPASTSAVRIGPLTSDPMEAIACLELQTNKAHNTKSFSEKRGYNKFIQLNGITTTMGTHSIMKPSGPVIASSRDASTPFSEIGASTPLPRYTPTNLDFQRTRGSSSQTTQAISPAPSYSRSKADQHRAMKRKVTITYIDAQKSMMETTTPLTPPLERSTILNLGSDSPRQCSPPREPINSLVAEVLAMLRRTSPETVLSPKANLRPLILPQDLENRSPILPDSSFEAKPTATRRRTLLLPQQMADRAALRLSSAIEEPQIDGISLRSFSVYSQSSWQIIGSSTSLACTAGSSDDLQAFEGLGLHPALKDWVPTHKRRGMCIPELSVSQRR
ncbi:hypothetical protein BDY19DRAFT_1056055 [Irpex rosettiformis]|uniref:Uncharacterized protein n=1 Tax=Irpex rosettiformis TaxID=378272 RepID=A0ACB8U802_9APHY|nr:hypothetical protein BDY19DRAFT_1056055 [Irpex rosettiformis]